MDPILEPAIEAPKRGNRLAPPSAARPASPAPGERWPSAGSYFALAYAWTWAFWIAAAATGGEVTSPPTLGLFALGGIGPLVAAIALTTRGGGAPARRALLRSTLAFRHVPVSWWAVIAVLAAGPSLIGLLVEAALLGRAPDFEELGGLAETPGSFAFILLFALAAGLVEEPGWRGYALERLRRSRSLLAASLIIGALWAIWHYPLYFVEGTFQSEQGFGSAAFWYLSLSIVGLAILYTGVQQGTGWIVAAAVAFHALGNATGEYLPVNDGARWITFAIILVLAVAVAARWRLR